MVAKSFIGKRVEFPRFCISLDLTIPFCGIKLGEPLSKLCQLISREIGDSFFDGFEFTHRKNDTTMSFRGLTHFNRADYSDSSRLRVHALQLPLLRLPRDRVSAPMSAAQRRSSG